MSIAVSAIPAPYIHSSQKRRKNTWYSIANGNWTDSNIWMSNSLTLNINGINSYPGQNIVTPIFPQVGDDVYINHTVTLNTTCTVNNLYISGIFKADNSSRSIGVLGDLQATGSVDFTSSNVNIFLYGGNNNLTNFTSGTSSTVTYARIAYDQNIMNLSYKNLTIINSGVKYATSNLTITGNFLMYQGATYNLLTYDLTVNGTTTYSTSTFLKPSSGNLLFIGNYNPSSQSRTDFSGNPTVELRGGISWNTYTSFYTGTSIWSFTTNNQNIGYGSGGVTFRITFDAPILIVGAISITTNHAATATEIRHNNTLNGTVAGSTFINKESYLVGYASPSALMPTGVFNYTGFANTVGYVFNGDYTLPYNDYKGLLIEGTGTKSLSSNTTVSSLLIQSSGILDCDVYDLSVSSITIILSSSKLAKTGAGNILFTGNLSIGLNPFAFSGNPTVELRGGISFGGTIGLISMGTGLWTFSTNNQSFTTSSGGLLSATLGCPILISGAITLTNSLTHGGSLSLSGTLDGNNALSTFDNRATASIDYKNATKPMVVGILQCNAAANTFKYNGDLSQDIKAGNYKTVEFGGTATPNDKTLQGNVVTTSNTTTGNAVVVLNGFTLT